MSQSLGISLVPSAHAPLYARCTMQHRERSRDCQVVLVTRSAAARDFVDRTLLTAGIAVWHETSAAEGAIAAKARGALCVCTPELEWRNIIRDLMDGEQPGPPMLLLLSTSDDSVWARALRAGAFDAVRISDGSSRLLDSIEYAAAHWRRQQTVRAALYDNAQRRAAGA